MVRPVLEEPRDVSATINTPQGNFLMADYGPQATSAPAGAIILNPGDDVSSIVNAAPAGATFYFEAGVYRGVSLWPKDGQTFIGAQGATLNGSDVLTDWTQSGNTWAVGGQTQAGPVFSGAEFVAGTERPGYPETVFIDNTPLKPVDALSKVVSGTFYFDYAADKIYIGDNPAGHTVEAGKVTDAFRGNATNVTVQNLVIEKYDPQVQEGAINGGQGWTIKNNEVRLNYAAGIQAHDGSQVIGNYVHDNGELGVDGNGNNIVVQGNELSSNGFWSGVSPYWSAGGLKFAETDNLVVQGNYSHDNNGSGLWTDIDNIHTLYEDNVVAHNTINGIQHEISYDAIIRNNTLVGNGYGDTRGWGWGADLDIQNSQNVQAYGNRIDMTGGNNGIIEIQQDRGSGAHGTYTTTGNQIHDNIVVDRDALDIPPESGNSHGVDGEFADYNVSGMLNGGNTWSNNQYFMTDGVGRFQLGGSYDTFAQFQAAAGETGSISQAYPDTSGWLTPAAGTADDSASPPPATSGVPVVTGTPVSDPGTSATDGSTSNAAPAGTADPNATGSVSSDGTTGTGTSATTGDSTSPPPATSGVPVVTGTPVSDPGASATDGSTSSAALTGTVDPNATGSVSSGGTTGTGTDMGATTGGSASPPPATSGEPVVTGTPVSDPGTSATDGSTSSAALTGTADPNAAMNPTIDTTAAGGDQGGGDIVGRHHHRGGGHVGHDAKDKHAASTTSAGESDTSVAQAPGHSGHLARLMGQYMATGFHDHQTGAGAIDPTPVPTGSPEHLAFLAAPLHHAA
ncbi:MAG TPA: right-handed parallel beta-helix repeat-containing protein [Devosia sp.]|nr:right-handed parallel beta-helix repeat-containing protein [Devosia sp.]